VFSPKGAAGGKEREFYTAGKRIEEKSDGKPMDDCAFVVRCGSSE